MLSSIRIGKFTSSNIHNLMKVNKNGSPSVAKNTYIEDVIIEARLGRLLNSVSSARPLTWGRALEPRVAAMLDPFEYEYCSETTICHPTIPYWVGTPDLIGSDIVADIKCPYTVRAFAKLVDTFGDSAKLKEKFPEYYWQLISNSILTNKKRAELIVYCPYKSELEEIQEAISEEPDNSNHDEWICLSEVEELPYINDGGYYKNLNRYAWTIDPKDQELLFKEVITAQSLIGGVQ